MPSNNPEDAEGSSKRRILPKPSRLNQGPSAIAGGVNVPFSGERKWKPSWEQDMVSSSTPHPSAQHSHNPSLSEPENNSPFAAIIPPRTAIHTAPPEQFPRFHKVAAEIAAQDKRRKPKKQQQQERPAPTDGFTPPNLESQKEEVADEFIVVRPPPGPPTRRKIDRRRVGQRETNQRPSAPIVGAGNATSPPTRTRGGHSLVASQSSTRASGSIAGLPNTYPSPSTSYRRSDSLSEVGSQVEMRTQQHGAVHAQHADLAEVCTPAPDRSIIEFSDFGSLPHAKLSTPEQSEVQQQLMDIDDTTQASPFEGPSDDVMQTCDFLDLPLPPPDPNFSNSLFPFSDDPSSEPPCTGTIIHLSCGHQHEIWYYQCERSITKSGIPHPLERDPSTNPEIGWAIAGEPCCEPNVDHWNFQSARICTICFPSPPNSTGFNPVRV